MGASSEAPVVTYTHNNVDTVLVWNGQQVTLTGVYLTGSNWFEFDV